MKTFVTFVSVVGVCLFGSRAQAAVTDWSGTPNSSFETAGDMGFSATDAANRTVQNYTDFDVLVPWRQGDVVHSGSWAVRLILNEDGTSPSFAQFTTGEPGQYPADHWQSGLPNQMTFISVVPNVTYEASAFAKGDAFGATANIWVDWFDASNVYQGSSANIGNQSGTVTTQEASRGGMPPE